MTERQSSSRRRQKQLFLVSAILALAGFVLLLALVISATSSNGAASPNSNAYSAELAQAMARADANTGAALIAETDCATCHLTGDGRAAPLFDGLGSLASSRRSPLSAEQYLYEAIVFPAAHLLNGYANAMPNDYGERFSPSEIGHMIAYLLTLTAQGDEP